MNRPKSDTHIGCRVTRAEADAIRRAAELDGVMVADWLRAAILEHLHSLHPSLIRALVDAGVTWAERRTQPPVPLEDLVGVKP